MALVALLKGVNVGGHRRFRPSVLARELEHLDVVNVGAAGTLIVRGRTTAAELRAEITRRLPFETEIMICRGNEVTKLLGEDFFAGFPARDDTIRFVSLLARVPPSRRQIPFGLPKDGEWMVKVLARRGRLVVGLHRRQMKAIGELGRLEAVFGVPLTTRGWNTMHRVAEALGAGPL